MRGDRPFLDTNILVYAFGKDDPRKPVATELAVRGGVVGVQTLNEFTSVLTGKLKQPWDEVVRCLQIINALCPQPVPVTHGVHMRGVAIAQEYGYHIYDSLMLAAALEADCTVFYSEDLRDGQEIDGMRIENPFVR